MTAVVWIVLAALGFIANLAIHEAAHAVALRTAVGGRIQSAGLGLPIPPMLTLAPRGRRTWMFTLSPWLIGAYVEPDHDSARRVAEASYAQEAWFAAAGVVANLIFGSALLAAGFATQGRWVPAAIWLGVAVVAWFARKAVAYILPLIGVAALAVVAYTVAKSAGEAQGVVGIAHFIGTVNSPIMALGVTAALSLSLALLNTVPIFPFDGGRVVDAGLRRCAGPRVSRTYQAVTGVVALAFIVYVIGSDVWSVAS